VSKRDPAINVRTPAEAFCQMATNVATGLEIEGEEHMKLLSVPRVPRELPVTLLIRNPFEIEDWKRFLG
jgi:hypothetical protein